MKKIFCVHSYGRTGTQWFANLLAKHSSVCVTHGPTDIVVDPYKKFTEVEKKEENIHIHKHMASHIEEFNIDEYFDSLIMNNPNHNYYGNVHGIPFGILSRSTKYKFNRIKLIRHPINRVESLVARCQYEIGFNQYAKASYKKSFINNSQHQYFKETSTLYDVDWEVNENYLFVNALMALFSDRIDYDEDVIHVCYERLTTDVEYFISVISILFDDDELLISHFANEYLNSTAIDKRTDDRTSLQRFSMWDDWKKHLFMLIMENDQKIKLYKDAGYYIATENHSEQLKPLLDNPQRKVEPSAYQILININSFINNLSKDKQYLLYGFGSIGQLIFPHLKLNIAAIIDKKLSKDKLKNIEGIPVITTEEIALYDGIGIIITPMIHEKSILNAIASYDNEVILLEV